jgi:diguanylate cyclase (GGDEF)-like protein/PAS domain S-box-containing protein
MSLSRMRVGHKILAATIVPLLLLAAFVVVAIVEMQQMVRLKDGTTAITYMRAKTRDIALQMALETAAVRGYVVTGDPSFFNVDTPRKALTGDLLYLDAHADEIPGFKDYLQVMEPVVAQLNANIDLESQLMEGGKRDDAIKAVAVYRIEKFDALADQMLDAAMKVTDAVEARFVAANVTAVVSLLVFGVAALVLGFVLSTIVARSIVRRLKRTEAALHTIVDEDFHRLTAAFERLGRGDLHVGFEAHPVLLGDSGRDEVAAIGRSYDAIGRGLETIAAEFARTTNRLQMSEEAMRESETRFRVLAEHAADMIVQTRADRTRAYVSPASRTMLGYEPDEIVEQDFADFIHPDDRAQVCAAYDSFLSGGGKDTQTYRLRRRDGSYAWCEARWVPAPEDARADGTACIAVVRDISERKATEARIAHLAHHDAVTGLPNRVLFEQRLDHALRRVTAAGSCALLCVDLDHFKNVNDTLGHAVGDALLRTAAARLQHCVREGDTVARLGGDEFAIILCSMSERDDALSTAERIVNVLSGPYRVDGRDVIVGASVGVSIAPDDGREPEILLKKSDIALYRAKGDGRHTYRAFEPEMERELHARRELDLELRRSLDEARFALAYQPIVRLSDARLLGFEALLRWDHPTRGTISPTEFIPVAEETGMIVPLGEWALREACTAAAAWPDDLAVCVNLSAVQLKSDTLVGTVRDCVRRSGIAAERLVLEVTESVLLSGDEGTTRRLEALRTLGARIALDDFGTGYSSLSYLRRFQFDTIKIDRSFVRELPERTESAAIVHAVLELAQRLGITTVAEGIETPAQLRALRELGCTQAQGFLFGKPQPARETQAMATRTYASAAS